jgi:hypothetical protein
MAPTPVFSKSSIAFKITIVERGGRGGREKRRERAGERK